LNDNAIGVPRPRLDAPEKVTGATRYAADGQVPGLLHARLVLATTAHAFVRGIDAEQALASGVVAVLTAADLPTVASGTDRTSEPLAREEIVFAGQPVAIVVAESEAEAEDGVEAVAVDYEPLPEVVDLEQAMRQGSPLARVSEEEEGGSDLASIHTDVDQGSDAPDEEQLSGNVLDTVRRAAGDAAALLEASDAVVEGTFRTPWVHQAYIEPQTATAWFEPNGTLVVSTSTQGTFVTRRELADAFGLPLERIRVIGEPLGGAFGGKFALIEPLVAGAALALRRPVRLVLTRTEDFQATNPAPAEITLLKIGGNRDGRLTAIEALTFADRGTNAAWGVEGATSLLIAGPYRWQAHDLRGYGVQTNRFTFGAYRAPGATPAAFAVETLLDELATELGLDPLELRLRNAVVEGDLGVSGNPFPVIGAREVIERVREHPLWQARDGRREDEGVGVALGYWPGGNEPASAVCRVDSDGTMTVVTSAVDMTGVNTGFAAIAAEAFGLSPDEVRVVSVDTGSGPYSGASGGSKITYTVGTAVLRAAEAAREKLLAAASEELEIAPADLEVVDAVVRAVGAPERSITVAELAAKALRFGGRYEPIEGHGGSAQTRGAPSVAAHLAHVRVDRETGEVELLGYAVAQDVGRALNPALVEGQMRGGATQGIGWALFEELAHDEAGNLLSGSFLEYAIPVAEHVPDIDTLIVEVPAPDGPYGAKGVGEAPVIAAPAAIANAIAAATGVRLRELPMTPPRVWAALQGAAQATT
jgi:CO/xanthine dehydrogenase Mo-binding subunit